jgi:hypothetical protein
MTVKKIRAYSEWLENYYRTRPELLSSLDGEQKFYIEHLIFKGKQNGKKAPNKILKDF